MRVYAYGARPPIEGADLVRYQISLATIYQRQLVLVERKRRDLVELLYRRACPTEWAAYDAATLAAETAAQAMRLTRNTGGELLRPDQEMRAEQKEVADAAETALDEARQREIETRQAWKDARRRVTPRLRPRLGMIDRGVKKRQKHIYNVGGWWGLAWGTRLKIGESVERAAQMSAKIGAMPHLPRYDGSGSIVVQLQGESGIGDKNGLAPKDALGGKDTRVRIEYVSPATWQKRQGRDASTGRGELVKNGPRTGQPRLPLPQPKPESKRTQRRKDNGGFHALASLRVGSDGREPIWATWPVVLHRPLPENAPIKWAQVHARRIGPRTTWELHATIDDEVPALRTEGPTLAVNLGWRTLRDGGLRVAYAVDSDGGEEEVRVPPAYIHGVEHVSSLRSIRDRNFERAKKALDEWTADGYCPEWLVEKVRYVDRWRSQRRLVRLLSVWRNHRFDGDASMFDGLVAWQKKDKHLWFWESDERAKLLRMRRDAYRNVAARWAAKYARILVTDMDLRNFATLPAPEDAPKSKDKIQRVLQKLAAPSELRGAINNACSTRGTRFEEVEALWKTQTCNVCGLVSTFAARQALGHTCECGARWDQDFNHCRNLLAAAKPPKDPSEPAEKKGRWKKRKELAAELRVVAERRNGTG